MDEVHAQVSEAKLSYVVINPPDVKTCGPSMSRRVISRDEVSLAGDLGNVRALVAAWRYRQAHAVIFSRLPETYSCGVCPVRRGTLRLRSLRAGPELSDMDSG